MLKRYVLALLTALLLVGSVESAHAITINFRARFSNLDPAVTQADLKSTIPGGASTTVANNLQSAPSTCPTDTQNKCVDFSLVLSRNDTRQFSVRVQNALGEVADSNVVTFQVPGAPVAPNLSVQVLSFN